jgi:hypothetical protein
VQSDDSTADPGRVCRDAPDEEADDQADLWCQAMPAGPDDRACDAELEDEDRRNAGLRREVGEVSDSIPRQRQQGSDRRPSPDRMRETFSPHLRELKQERVERRKNKRNADQLGMEVIGMLWEVGVERFC